MNWRRFRGPLLLLTVMLAMTGWLAHKVQRNNARELENASRHALVDVLDRTEALLGRYEYGLLGARGAIALTGVDGMDRVSFERYSRSRNYAREFPGARGFGFIRRVPVDKIPEYLAGRRRAGWEDFKIRQLAPHEGERFIIELIEPLGPNRPAIGLDIASERNRLLAARSAMRTGTATLTGPITLVQAGTAPKQAFLLLLPYADKASGNVMGWTYAPLVTGEVLAGLGRLPNGRLVMTDVTSAPAEQFFAAGQADGKQVLVRTERKVMGRLWSASFEPSTSFVTQLRLPDPGQVLGIGVLVSLLCSALAMMRVLNDDRRRRLQASQAQLAEMVEASPDAIISTDREGRVTSWNPGAATILQFSAQEALGRPLSNLIVPTHLRAEELATFDRVMKGDAVSIPRTIRTNREGKELHVSLMAAPLQGQEGVRGMSLTMRDISSLVAAQDAVHELNSSLETQVQDRTNQLESARRDLRTILDAVPSMIGYWDRDLINRFANSAYGAWWSLEPAELIGRPMREVMPAALALAIRDRVNAALGGEIQVFEQEITHRNGSLRHLLVQYLPDSVDGTVNGFYVVVNDVSEVVASRTALALALRENDVLVRTINEELLYSVTDIHGTIIEVNDNFCAALGYEREQLIGKDHRMLRSGEHDRAFWAEMWQNISSGQTWNGLICNRGANGDLKWFDTVIAPYFDEQGTIERYVGLRTDVTERISVDAALRHMSALFSNVLRAASEMSIIATDPDGLITVFNSGAQRLTGYCAEEMIGRSTPAPLHLLEEVAARGQELTELLGEPVEGFRTFVTIAERDGAETREWTYIRKDGSRLPVSLSVTPMRDTENAMLGYVGIAIDIERRKKDEAELQASTLSAQQASIAKSQFVANMSHEIRTPMNAVLGMLELVRRSELNPSQRDYVNRALNAGKALLSLLNDVLDFSRIDANKLELDIQAMDVESILRELSSIVSGNNVGKPVEIMFAIGGDVPPVLMGDRMRLQQVLVNLAGNAVKFTKEGNVTIGLEVLSTGAATVRLRFSVSDTGIGIPADQIGTIFDSFTQAESSVARRFGGSGLGLAISARLVGLMGGRLQVASEVGHGSRFWFDADFVWSTAQPVAGMTSALDGVRVLVVDDNSCSREILSAACVSFGCRVDTAPDAATAIAKLGYAAANKDRYAVVIMDVRMPGMDGLEAAKAIAANPENAAPVILISAYAVDSKQALMETYGTIVKGFLSKPLLPSDLQMAILQAVTPAPVERLEKEIQDRSKPLAGMRMLVVEDNELNRIVASELLGAEGAQVDLADGGERGIAMALAARPPYTAILMDVQMPDVDGLEATRRLRMTESGARMLIVAMTANVMNDDIAACMAAGMDDHVGKPFDIDEVVVRLLKLLVQRGGSVPELVPVTHRGGGDGVDVEGAIRRMGGNARLYSDMVMRFRQEAQGFIDELGSSGLKQSTKAATLHAFRGLASMVGAVQLSSYLLQEEKDALAGGLGAQDWLANIRRLLDASLDHLDRHVQAQSPILPSTELVKELDDEQFAILLTQLLPLLDSMNLHALDFAELLPKNPTDTRLRELAEAIRELRFADAATLTRILIG